MEKSAGVVIFRKEKKEILYLLLHYPGGHWDFPKGHIEKGENPEETAEREVKEETEIKDLKVMPGFRTSTRYFYKKGKKTIFKVVFFYLAKTKTKRIKISFEHQGFKWLPYKEALKNVTFKNTKEVLKKAHQFLESLY